MRKRTLTKSDIRYKTIVCDRRIVKTIELAKNYQEDPEKDKRLEVSECPVCYYIKERLGGDAMTQAECAFCDKIISSGNTNIDVLCVDCASKNNLCKHCGAYLKGI